MALWLYLHFPQLQLDNLHAQGMQVPPTIIVSGKNHSVIQLNRSAQQLGVRKGMGLGAAAAMSSSLCVHEYSEVYTQKRLIELAQWLYLDTAEIHLSEPEGLLLKVSSMLSLHQDLGRYWQVIQTRLETQHVHYHFSLGYSPIAAQLLAQNQFDSLSQNREQLMKQLGKLPINTLALTNQQQQKLTRVGVKTVQALLDIPLVELGKRFDTALVHYVGRLQGKLHHPITFYQPPEVFERHVTLLYEIENLDFLARPLLKLLVQLEQFLRLRNKLTQAIELTFYQRDCDALQLSVGSAQGEYRADKWQALCQLVLERTQLSAPLQAVALKVPILCEPQTLADDLFSERIGTMTAAGLLSTLQAKLGEEAVQGIQPMADARPEHATGRVEPLVHAKRTTVPEQKPPLCRPNLLLPRVQPLQCKVILLQGPERIATGWWDGHEVERDYFVAQDENYRRLWVFRDRQQRWFMHGIFS
ncbi:Y-family DNA polymerase [Pseudoalteromonas obscura]|uniref:DNA polymerase Y family protein n=1 Tax=Pseudoalteromonas obscura TaxID=3048491 RepID=A0ABT7EHT0_9GAMM|nr:DNA polymerase Y family protein [Pseudoalteromonas sp. P94(2023)]MDK2594605.1 DNA polymerase Y family protein [Pseudoalteromonas sp. P94(2023)]